MARYERGEFSVTQFFTTESETDKRYETVRRYVSAEEALKAFMFFTHNVAARVGLTVRVIITDGGDCIAAEWQHGKGLIFPPKEK